MKRRTPRWIPHRKYLLGCLALLLALLTLLMGPAATALQMRQTTQSDPAQIDAVYLVCGARAQQQRLQALTTWLDQDKSAHVIIWIGNDTQNSLWSRRHGRNLTRAEWAREHISHQQRPNPITILPGTFSNTDGEMESLARFLHETPNIQHLALVTSRFHIRRTLKRLAMYAPATTSISSIPTASQWEDRAPWIVAAEWLKILRDHGKLSQHPWFSRQPHED
jgi:uncharacterized SAM-binding protein YcdF (DUF218 family)